MANLKHTSQPPSMTELSRLAETIYDNLIDLIARLQVFKPLQQAAEHAEDHASLEALEMLHRDLYAKSTEIDRGFHSLRQAIDRQKRGSTS